MAVVEIVDDLDVLLDFLDTPIASQGQLGLGDTTDEISVATDAIDAYVDAKSDGTSSG